jgi:hypothetical protein
MDILQTLPEIDPRHVGITGGSMGAILSASVCGIEPRVHKAFLMLGGCDVRKIILTAHETRKLRAFIEALPAEPRERVLACVDRLDPIHAKDALRRLAEAGRLRMTCAELDQVVPPECSRRLAEAAGFAERVTWLKGMDHYSAMAGFPQIVEEAAAFFGEEVPPDWRPPEGEGEKSAPELLGVFLSGLAAFLGGEPVTERAHMVGLETEAAVGGKTYRASCDLARGTGGRFKLTGTFPEVGRAGLGLGEHPWLLGAGKRVFLGSVDAREGATAASLVTPQRLMKLRVGAGTLAVAALSPEALKQYYSLGDVKRANGERVVEVTIDHKKARGRLELTFTRDGTPLNAAWSFGGTSGKARFSHWRPNAVTDDAVFEPPPELPRQEVRQEDVLRMFAAVLEFAVEATE